MTSEGKKLVAYCGLYCGTCDVYEGQFMDAAKRLQGLCQKHAVAAWAPQVAAFVPAMAGYAQFEGVLGWFTTFDCAGCREGGGDPNCKLRACVKERGLDGCWECVDLPCDLRREFFGPDKDPVGNCERIREVGPEAWAAEQVVEE